MQRRPSVSRSTTDLTDQTEENTGPRRTQRSTAGKPPLRLAQGMTTATQIPTTQRQRPLHSSQSQQDLRRVTEETEPMTEETRPTPEEVRQLQAQYTRTQVSSNGNTRANDVIDDIANMSIDELLRSAGFDDPLPQTQSETQSQTTDNTLLQLPHASNTSTPHLANAAPSTVDQGTVEVAAEAIDESQRWLEENLDPVDNEPETRVNNASTRSSPPRRERRAGSALDDLRIRIGDMDELTDPEEELERYGAPSQMSQQDISMPIGDRRKLDLTVPTPEELADELMAVTVVIPHPNTITPDFRDRLERFLKHRGVYIDVYGPVMSLLAAFANTVVKELTDRFSRTLDRRKNEFERDRAHLQEEARNAYQDAMKCEESEQRSQDQLRTAVEKMRPLHELVTRLSATRTAHENTIRERDRTIKGMQGHVANQNDELEELRGVNGINQTKIRDLTTQVEGYQKGMHKDPATDADVKQAQEILNYHSQIGMKPHTVAQIITLIQRMQVRLVVQTKAIKDKEAEVQSHQTIQKDFEAAATNIKEELKEKAKEHQELKGKYLHTVSDYRTKAKDLQLKHERELGQKTQEVNQLRARYNQLCDKEAKQEKEAARVVSVQVPNGDIGDLKDRLATKSADLQGQINKNKHLTETITQQEETIAHMRTTTSYTTTEAMEHAKKCEEALGETQKKLDNMTGMYDLSRQRYDELVAERSHCIHNPCYECNPPPLRSNASSVRDSMESLRAFEEQEALMKEEGQSRSASAATIVIKPKPAVKREPAPTIEQLFKMPDSEVLLYRGGGRVQSFDTITPLTVYKGESNTNPWEWGDGLIERVTARTTNVSKRVNTLATAVLFIRRHIETLIGDTAKGFYKLFIEKHHSEDLDFFALLGYLASELPHKPKRFPLLEDIKQGPTEQVDDFFSRLVVASENLYPGNEFETMEKRALRVAQQLAKNCRESYRSELNLEMNMDVEDPTEGEDASAFRKRMITALRKVEKRVGNIDVRKILFRQLDSEANVAAAQTVENFTNFRQNRGRRGDNRGRFSGRGQRGSFSRPPPEVSQHERQESLQTTERTTQQSGYQQFRQPRPPAPQPPPPQPGYAQNNQGRNQQQPGNNNRQRGEVLADYPVPYPTPMKAADGGSMANACWNCFQTTHMRFECPFAKRKTLCLICGHDKIYDPHPVRDCIESGRQPQVGHDGITLWRRITGAMLDWDLGRSAADDARRQQAGGAQCSRMYTEEEVQQVLQQRLQQRLNTLLTDVGGGNENSSAQMNPTTTDNVPPPNDGYNRWA